MIRAKIAIESVIEHGLSHSTDGPPTGWKTGEQISARAVSSEDDPSSENYSFSVATPSLSLQMYISKPSAFDKLVRGKEYYLDFTPVDGPHE